MIYSGEIAVDCIQGTPIEPGTTTHPGNHHDDVAAEIAIDINWGAGASKCPARWAIFITDGVHPDEGDPGIEQGVIEILAGVVGIVVLDHQAWNPVDEADGGPVGVAGDGIVLGRILGEDRREVVAGDLEHGGNGDAGFRRLKGGQRNAEASVGAIAHGSGRGRRRCRGGVEPDGRRGLLLQ